MTAPFAFVLPPGLAAREPPERRGIARDHVRSAPPPLTGSSRLRQAVTACLSKQAKPIAVSAM